MSKTAQVGIGMGRNCRIGWGAPFEHDGAREGLRGRGVDVEPVRDLGGILFARFADPDGNSWLLQEIPPRFRKK